MRDKFVMIRFWPSNSSVWLFALFASEVHKNHNPHRLARDPKHRKQTAARSSPIVILKMKAATIAAAAIIAEASTPDAHSAAPSPTDRPKTKSTFFGNRALAVDLLQCLVANVFGSFCMITSDAVRRWTGSTVLGGFLFYIVFVIVFARIYQGMKKGWRIPYIVPGDFSSSRANDIQGTPTPARDPLCPSLQHQRA